MTDEATCIWINGNGNVVGDNNQVTIIKKQYFIGEYEYLQDAYIEPLEVFERVNLEHFVGREWLLAKIDTFLRDHDRGYFILEADAGIGKTTFMAWLVKQRGYIHHFVELAPGEEGVTTALRSLAAQLILACRLHNDMGKVLPTSASRPDYLFRLLKQASDLLQDGHKIVLVIDALDQAGTLYGQNVLGLPTVLPKGVFIVISHRPGRVTLDTDKTPRDRLLLLAN